MSECRTATIRKAAAGHPIAAVEVELSLFSTDILTIKVAYACKELGIPIIAYSPLSCGFFTEQLRQYEGMPENNVRRYFLRFRPDVFDENLKLVDEVEKMANRKWCLMVWMAIPWVSAQGRTIGAPMVPVPGATAVMRAEDNTAMVDLVDRECQRSTRSWEGYTLMVGESLEGSPTSSRSE